MRKAILAAIHTEMLFSTKMKKNIMVFNLLLDIFSLEKLLERLNFKKKIKLLSSRTEIDLLYIP